MAHHTPSYATSSSFNEVENPTQQNLAYPFSNEDYLCLATNPDTSFGRRVLNRRGVRRPQPEGMVQSRDISFVSTISDTVHQQPRDATSRAGAPNPYGLVKLHHRPAAKTSSSPSTAVQEPEIGSIRWWRTAVPFSVPVRRPELLCNDPSSYHSVTKRSCADRGMRFVDPSGYQYYPWVEAEGVFSLDAERGMTGVSLQKHSTAYRMTDAKSYPGMRQRAAVRRELILARKS